MMATTTARPADAQLGTITEKPPQPENNSNNDNNDSSSDDDANTPDTPPCPSKSRPCKNNRGWRKIVRNFTPS